MPLKIPMIQNSHYLSSIAFLCVFIGMVLAFPTTTAAEEATATSDQAVILMYHRVGEKRLPATNITLAQFRAHLQELRQGPYKVLPLDEIVAALKNGRTLPNHSIAITFDDAFLSIYETAWPLLKAAKFPFTLFVSTEPLDEKTSGYMTWAQLREMAADPLVTIGHHGHSHNSFLSLTKDQRIGDILTATARFQKEIDTQPKLFAYPFGEYDSASPAILRQLSFNAAFGQFSSVASPADDIYALPRFTFNERYGDIDRFRLITNALALPAYDILPKNPHLSHTHHNPPAFGFTLKPIPASPTKALAQLSCYPSHMKEAATLTQLGEDRIEIRFTQPFPEGRNRINCTMPGSAGRWYWFGRPFFNTKSRAASNAAGP